MQVYHRQAQFGNRTRELPWPRTYARSLAPTFPWFNILWLFVAGLKDKASRTNLYTLQELRNNIRRKISIICGQILTAPITCPSGIPSGFGQKGNIFRTCCSAGEFFFLDFLNSIITANLFLAAFTDCYTSRDSASDVTLEECRAGAYRSSRRKMTP